MTEEMKKPKVMFVANAWCGGKYEWGISEWDANLIQSLKNTSLADVRSFHLDQYYREHQMPGDAALLEDIHTWKPDIIILSTNRMPCASFDVPTITTFQEIKKLKIPVVAVWTDLAVTDQVEITKVLLPYVELHVGIDCPSAIIRAKNPKYVYLWSPKDPKNWNDPKKKRDIDISYFGSPKRRRIARIEYLLKCGVKIEYGGGERQEHVATEEYADQLQRSKIALGFSFTNHSRVTNARLYEATISGAMLLEEENFETPKFFIPYVEYVPYANNEDLVKKAKYYLEHDEERETIARNGQKKAAGLYSARRFWKLIFDKILYGADIPSPALAWSNLSHVPKWRTARLMFLNAFFSQDILYRAYMFCAKRMNRDWIDYQLKKFKAK